jgi:hypothetical protein
MRKPRLPRLVDISGRWRRLVAMLATVAAAALAVGAILGADLTGSSRGASNSRGKAGSGTATVERRDLVATDTESGTLSYSDVQTVYNRVSGTVTWLPAVGDVIKPGHTLYKVDNAPVVLFKGSVPAYRDLSDGVTDGPDVKELERNLVDLGFDPNHDITVDDTFDVATTAAVERWQASVGETQTGVVTLGQIVFLPGPQRITQVNTVLGSNGSSSSGSGSGSGSGTNASTTVSTPRPEYVSLTTTPTTSTPANATPTTAASTTADTSTTTTTTAAATTTTPSGFGTGSCASGSGQAGTPGGQPGAATGGSTGATTTPPTCDKPAGGGKPAAGSQAVLNAALTALLKAETQELRNGRSSAPGTSGAGSRSSGGGGGGAAGTAAAGGGGSFASSGGSGSSGSGSGTGSGTASGSGSGTAQAILDTTSTQLVVTVDLDATKQSEAVVGEPVTVELPDGIVVNGTITEVSPVAENSSSSSSGSGSGSGSGSSGSSGQPSATIPVTIALTGRHKKITGLDQAAVSVNFEQQKATNVLSVPVTALVATAGGGYAVQTAAAPQRLIPVTPGLFAAGYVEISGAGIYSGLQVTDSQG